MYEKQTLRNITQDKRKRSDWDFISNLKKLQVKNKKFVSLKKVKGKTYSVVLELRSSFKTHLKVMR